MSEVSMEKLYEIAKSRKFICLERACPYFDRCPEWTEFPIVNKTEWLVRNCPKVLEAGKGIK